MKAFCALCGRKTTPFAFIGAEPIGPTCAKRAGLTKTSSSKGGRIRLVPAVKQPRAKIPVTMDLFDGLPADAEVAS